MCLCLVRKERKKKRGYKKLEDVGWTSDTEAYDIEEGKGVAMQKQNRKTKQPTLGRAFAYSILFCIREWKVEKSGLKTTLLSHHKTSRGIIWNKGTYLILEFVFFFWKGILTIAWKISDNFL